MANSILNVYQSNGKLKYGVIPALYYKKKTKYNMILQKIELMKLEPQYSVSFVAQQTPIHFHIT